MLGDYGFLTPERGLLGPMFEGIKVPSEEGLDPETAAEISRRSRAQVLVALNLRRNSKELAYISGAYDLRMRWIALPSGTVLVSKTKALYFMPQTTHVKELMQACLEEYRVRDAGEDPPLQ
jgi:hypothetical protein